MHVLVLVPVPCLWLVDKLDKFWREGGRCGMMGCGLGEWNEIAGASDEEMERSRIAGAVLI